METQIKNEKVQALINQVKEGVTKIQSSEDWMHWLDANAKFWKYSFSNQMLIALQNPDATKVAGYRTWLKLGRFVKKGEHGIHILAPIFSKKEEAELEEPPILLRGFKAVSVFDLSQTDGEALPAIYHPLVGEAPEGVFEKVKQLIESKGYSVEFQQMPDGKYGFVDIKNLIALRAGVSTAQSLKTLIHEVAHALLGHLNEKIFSLDMQELEAETTSWIVCKNLGLETDKTSFAYLAVWSLGKDRDKMLEEAAQRASILAKEILERLEVNS